MTSYYEKSGLFVLTWNDNGPITVISNVHTYLPCDFPIKSYKHFYFKSFYTKKCCIFAPGVE